MHVVRTATRFVSGFTRLRNWNERHQKSADGAARRALEEGHGRRNASVGQRLQAVFSCDKERSRWAIVIRLPVTAERPQGKAVQVPVRWSQETPPLFASQARMLTAALEAKHGQGVCFDVLTVPDPAVQQQVIHKATAAVKRK